MTGALLQVVPLRVRTDTLEREKEREREREREREAVAVFTARVRHPTPGVKAHLCNTLARGSFVVARPTFPGQCLGEKERVMNVRTELTRARMFAEGNRCVSHFIIYIYTYRLDTCYIVLCTFRVLRCMRKAK